MSLLTNLVAYYKLDGNSNDATGNGNNGTDTNISYSASNGKLIQGGGFSGISPGTSKIVVPALSALVNSSFLSVSCWVKFTTITNTSQFASQYAGSGNANNPWFFGYNFSSNTLNFGINDLTGSEFGMSPTSIFTTNIWYHCVAVFDGTQTGNSNRCKLYINGLLQTLSFSGTIPTTIIGSGMATNIPLWLGTLQTVQSSQTLNGALDEVGIWNRALTQSEVSQLYNGGTGFSFPFNSFNGSTFFSFM